MPAALLLAWHPEALDGERHDAFERVAAQFPARVLAMERHDHADGRTLVRTWTHRDAVGGAPALDPSTGSWLTVLGNPVAPHLRGIPAQQIPERLLRQSLDGAGPPGRGLSPPFALAFADARVPELWIVADPCGLQHLYVREDSDGTVWVASSLLALGAALGGTLDRDAAAEWLAAGHFVSERTVLREVRKLGAGERLRLGAGGCRSERDRTFPATPGAGDDERYRAAFLAALADGSAGSGTAAELTGGLDSRLVLSGRIAAGLPTLSWTLGARGSAELQTVARLQRRARFEHLTAVLDPTLAPEFPALVEEMHVLADGEVNALEYAPLLHAFAVLDGRRSISMSGSGGEIARGYYYAALDGAGGIDAGVLTKKLSGASGAVVRALAGRFPDPLAPLRDAVDGVLAGSAAPTPEARLEDFYIRARMQRFAGRNITTTGHFCRQALPYFGNDVVAASLALGPGRKRDGRVVRDAIAAWTPQLARVPLDTGIAVSARSWRHPATQLRWGVAMGRKALVKFGGAAGRRVAAAPPDPVPWDAYRASPGLQALVRETLAPRDRRVDELLDPAATDALVERGLAGGALYPLGLVLTLELTLRRAVR